MPDPGAMPPPSARRADDAVPATSTEAVVVRGLDSYYGSAHILHGVDLTLTRGSTTALLGRNGAGKTTLLRSIVNSEVRVTGTVHLGEIPLSGLATYKVARAGVQLVPDDRRILAGLTVAENLLLGGNGATGERPPLSISEVVTLFPLLDRLLDRRGNQLSGGEQQLVAIARAMIGHPSVLLMDEPSEGLAPRIVEQVGEAIAKLQMRDDLTILLAEQNARFALGVAESVAVLDGGRVVFSGSRAAFGADPDLERRYLTV